MENALAAEGQAQLDQANAYQAEAQAVASILNRVATTHRDDGVGVAMDIVGIALSLALIPTGLGLVAGVALLGGLILLGTDTYAYVQEIGGDDEGAEQTKEATEYYRIAATAATLPDAVYGGYKAIRELIEARDLLTEDRASIASQSLRSGNATDPARAERLRKTAEAARLRAQLRTEEIRASLLHEITPRGTGIGSAILLVREEIQEKESTAHEIFRWLRFHCVSSAS